MLQHQWTPVRASNTSHPVRAQTAMPLDMRHTVQHDRCLQEMRAVIRGHFTESQERTLTVCETALIAQQEVCAKIHVEADAAAKGRTGGASEAFLDAVAESGKAEAIKNKIHPSKVRASKR